MLRVLDSKELKAVSGGAAPGGAPTTNRAPVTSTVSAPASKPTTQTPAQVCASVGLVVSSVTYSTPSSTIATSGTLSVGTSTSLGTGVTSTNPSSVGVTITCVPASSPSSSSSSSSSAPATPGSCTSTIPASSTTPSTTTSDASDTSAAGGFAGGDAACVQVASFLPGGSTAGEVAVGSVMQLGDERTLEPSTGQATYSKRKKAAGFRITTASGVSLVCSNTAPIPTSEGIVLAPQLAGKSVAVRRDDGETINISWDQVAAVDSVGEIDIQHISLNDKCFWAGEQANAFILHHNKANDEDPSAYA